MYMILASQFESLVHPITILLSLPLAVPFGFLSLWFFKDTLNDLQWFGVDSPPAWYTGQPWS